jgi:uncharacterized protein
MSPLTKTVILLTLSNIFMNLAWYGHLSFKFLEGKAVWVVILVSWLIALPEYCFQVPANRIGKEGGIHEPQLKIIQEVISISTFMLLNLLIFRATIRTTDFVAFGLILAAVIVFLWPRLVATTTSS